MAALPYVVFLIPIAGMAMVLGIVGIVFWYKARERELQIHQDLRQREMDHQRRMKEMDLEIEKSRERQASAKVA
jgi:hypothetical protein